MSRRKSRKKLMRPRNYVFLTMIENVKGGAMRDRKKENDKKRCRRPIREDD